LRGVPVSSAISPMTLPSPTRATTPSPARSTRAVPVSMK
jgi:hypothetical protein